MLPDGPVTISRRHPAVPRRDSARQRPVDRLRPRDAHLHLRPGGRSELLPGRVWTISSARRTSCSPATPTTTSCSGCRRTTRSFRASFISTNQFATFEYRNVVSERTLQTARFGYSRTRIGQNVEANLASPLPPFVDGPRAGRRHRHRRHAAVRTAELRESAARAERLQRTVRPDAHARAGTC